MSFLELFDETLDINSTENYELSIQASPEEFSFSILDTIRNKYILLRSSEPDENRCFTADNIKDIIRCDDFLTKKFRKTNIILPTRGFTLVPSPLFDPARKEEYYSFNLGINDNEIILTNRLTEPDAYVVFSVPRSLIDLLRDTYPAVHPFHHSKPLLGQVARLARKSGNRLVHVHVEKEFFNLLISEHDMLKFCNTFKFRNISDILYHVLNVFKSASISNDATIHFSGNTSRHDDIYSAFALYIRNLVFPDPSGNFTFSYVFNEIGLHRYFNLFSAANCE
jgi:hypothetical protein